MKIKAIVLGVLAATAVSCGGYNHQNKIEKLIEQEIAQVSEHYKAVGLAVAAVKDGEIVYNASFGYKDWENKIPLGNDDILRIASISKSFVATSILQLVEQGKLSLDADVSELMGFVIRNPKYPDTPITVRMLLSHTSSMSDSNGYFTFDNLHREKSSTWEKAWNSYEPGSKYQSCKLGYNTLGAIIEIVSGERFDKYVSEHILEPLGVYGNHNVMELDPEKLVKIYKYRALVSGENAEADPNSGNNSQSGIYTCTESAYDSPAEQLANYQMGYSTTVFSPTGGLKISAKDLAKVMMMHMNYGTLGDVKILSKEMCELMQSEIVPTNYPQEKYGMAILSSNDYIKGIRVVGHDGIALGAYTSMFWNQERNFGVVVMTNGCDDKTDKVFANIMCETAEVLYKYFGK